jgi:hypothetical protein
MKKKAWDEGEWVREAAAFAEKEKSAKAVINN